METVLRFYAVGMVYGYIFLAIYAVLELFWIRFYNGYMTEYREVGDRILSHLLASFISICAVYFVTMIAWNIVHPPYHFFILFAARGIFSIVWSKVAADVTRNNVIPLKTVVIYRNANDHRRLKVVDKFIYRLDVLERIEIESGEIIHSIIKPINDAQAVFLFEKEAGTRNGLVKYCKEIGKLGFLHSSCR